MCRGISPSRVLLNMLNRQATKARSGRTMEYSGDGFSRLTEYLTKDLDKNARFRCDLRDIFICDE